MEGEERRGGNKERKKSFAESVISVSAVVNGGGEWNHRHRGYCQ